MAWIQSNQGLERNIKTTSTAERLEWDLDKLIGFLHRFWWWALEQAETGVLVKYSNLALSKALKVDETVIQVLCDEGWVDADRKIHDWWVYAGGYLKSKYRTSNPDKLAEIMDIYGVKSDFRQTKVSQTKDSLKTDLRQTTPKITAENLLEPPKVDGLKTDFSQTLVCPDKIDKIDKIDKTDEIRQPTDSQTTAIGNSAIFSINYEKPTLLDKIIFIYKYMKGYEIKDTNWDIANKPYLKKYYEQARDIVEMFQVRINGKFDEAETLQDIKDLFVVVTDLFKKKNLNWNLDTFKKYAFEYKQAQGETNV